MALNLILQTGEMGLNLGHLCTCGLSTTLEQHLSVTACLMLVVYVRYSCRQGNAT